MDFETWFNKQKKSVRNNVLKQLLFIYFNYFYEPHSPQTNKLFTRPGQEGLRQDPTNIAFAITIQDIQKLLHCSERTAREYRDTLRIIFLYI